MKAVFRVLLCLLLALAVTCSAMAAPRFPAHQGDVTDAAAVLPQTILTDLESYNKLISKADGLHLVVVTVDFLDGVSIEDYALQLREAWQLKGDDLLLLLAVGEDRCTFSAGKDVRLSGNVLQKLLDTSFEEPFLRQSYSEAVCLLMPALTEEINKAYRTSVTCAGLFGLEAAPALNPIERLTNWASEYITPIIPAADEERSVTDEDEDTGFSLGKILLTIFLLSVIFGKRKRRSGCGCAPFSSLFAALGLWKLWGKK